MRTSENTQPKPTRTGNANGRHGIPGHDCIATILGINTDLLTGSTKSEHSNDWQDEYYNVIQYFAPAWASGHNVCAYASDKCTAACLHTAGRASFDAKIPAARLRRTKLFYACKPCYLSRLDYEIAREYRKANRLGRRLALRLNGTSDIPWEHVGRSLMAKWSDVQFYDYTKYPLAIRPTHKLPANYDLTYSYSENSTDAMIEDNLSSGRNVAVVFGRMKRTANGIPSTWRGRQVITGDQHDLRFLESGRGVFVGLNAKGRAIGAQAGFVVYAANIK